MTPYELIGLPYRLGANPDRHQAADCVSLSRTVLAYYGITSPTPQRSWYRRLRRGDTAVFREQLTLWGDLVNVPTVGVVALCKTPSGFALATFCEQGWISFVGQEVIWSPIGALPVLELYSPQKSNSVKPSV